MKIQSLRSGIALVLALFFIGCGGSKQKGGADTAPTTTNKTGEPAPPTKADQAACDQFFGVVQAVLRDHLTKNPADQGKIITAAFNAVIDDLINESSDTEKADVKKMIDPLKVSEGASMSTCSSFQALIPAFPKIATLQERVSKNRQSPLVALLRAGLYYVSRQLDFNSEYLNPWRIQSFLGNQGAGAGIIFLQRTDYFMGRKAPYMVVLGVYPESANREAVKSTGSLPLHSRIISVEGKKISEMSYVDAIEAVNFFEAVDGKFANGNAVPESIEVTVKKPPQFEKEETVTLKTGAFTRIPIWVDPSFENQKKIARIRVLEFAGNATDEFTVEYAAILEKQLGTQLAGLIIDLRGNGGGLATEALALLGRFLPYGSVVEQIVRVDESVGAVSADGTRKLKPVELRKVTDDRLTIHVPHIFVLVDRLSASAAETSAAAFKDYKRAYILGEPTFGKGIGQSVLQLAAPIGGGFVVTNFYIFSPLGLSQQLDGVAPDVPKSDPVLDWQKRETGKPVRMADYAESNEWKNLIIAKPTISPGKHPDFVTSENQVSKENLPKDIVDPGSCKLTPTDATQFTEETDCLFDLAKAYLEKMVQTSAR